MEGPSGVLHPKQAEMTYATGCLLFVCEVEGMPRAASRDLRWNIWEVCQVHIKQDVALWVTARRDASGEGRRNTVHA